MKSFYRVPGNFKNDISAYKKSLEQFLNNGMHPTQFRAIRVPFGVYEQRTNNTFMMRIRIPAGGVLPEQMECIAKLSKEFGSGILHTTTRQDIQIHKVALEDTPAMMEALLEVGLTSKGGGGNTVRNITACSDSGVCEKEVFDCSPHAIALTEYLIKDPRSYSLPRKFKVAFSGCPLDCALATVNDVGFIAVEKEKKRGFRVYVAGGMGVSSRVAQLLEEFVEEDEVANVTEALKRLFDKNGNRRNKHKARMRFLIEKLGKDEFLRLYKQELSELKKDGGIKLDVREVQSSPTITDAQAGGKPASDSDEKDYKIWFSKNVVKQRQPGYYSVRISLSLGDMSSETMTSFATAVKKFGEKSIRATNEQNLLLRWVHESELKDLFSELKSLDLAESVALVNDIICCAGSSTCRLGLCLSRSLSEGVSKEFSGSDEFSYDMFKDVSVKVSGCPNSCGHHPIGGIGLFGAVRRIGDDLAPYYNILLGGRVEEGKTVLGEEIGLAHAKDVPKIMLKFMQDYKTNSNEFKDYYEYLEVKGKKVMKSVIEEYSSVPSYEEDNNYYCDWGTGDKFSLAGRGAGECGAGIFDIIEVDFEEAASALEKVESADSVKDSSINLYEAINRTSRALLVTRGAEASNDLEAFELFEKEFIDSGLVQSSFTKLMFLASEFKKGNLRDEAIIEKKDQIKEFAVAVKDLYDSMDDSLQFKKSDKVVEKSQSDKKEKEGSGIALFDLRGVKCPFNYVKAKLRLEMMEIGDELEIFLDDGEPVRNVPNSLKNDGQELSELEKVDDYYRFVLKKKV